MAPVTASRCAFIHNSHAALYAILILTGSTILINVLLSFLEDTELFGSLKFSTFLYSNHSAAINDQHIDAPPNANIYSTNAKDLSSSIHIASSDRQPIVEATKQDKHSGDNNNNANNPQQQMTGNSVDDVSVSLPGPKFPKQEMLDIGLIRQSEGSIGHHCKFRGKVFGIGLSKTGTSSLADMLGKGLQYKCIRSPMITCGYYPLYYYMDDAMLPLYVATEDISWLWHSKPLHEDFMQSVLSATVFADAPWNHLYPVYDQLIPANHSKFILTVRDSTRDLINSNMKMFVRGYVRREYGQNSHVQFDYTNFTRTSPRESGIRVSWRDFWMQSARQYEVHNRDVVEYFTKRGRLDDLLIINLAEESRKQPYSEQWYKVTNFLGCPNVTRWPLPKKNTGKAEQIDFFPRDYVFHWQNYSWPPAVRRIFKLVDSAHGEYNENTFNMLKSRYGKIYDHKKRRRRRS